MRKRKSEGELEQTEKKPEHEPDCCTCAERRTCERYQENSFCTRWHSNDPEKQGIDPNEAWMRGGEVAF